jgi:hypothetical protein
MGERVLSLSVCVLLSSTSIPWMDRRMAKEVMFMDWGK